MEVGGELQLGQVIQRLRRNGQGGVKECGGGGESVAHRSQQNKSVHRCDEREVERGKVDM